jgi:hypothetical protein
MAGFSRGLVIKKGNGMKRALHVVESVIEPATKGLMSASFVYKKGSDVQQIWRKHGWIPPTEYRNDFEFKKNREAK